MKEIIFCFVLFIFIACNKDEEQLSKLTATVNGTEISLQGNATMYYTYKDKLLFRRDYFIRNLDNPQLFIEVLDTTMSSKVFSESNIFLKYSFINNDYENFNYTERTGFLKIESMTEKVISGVFEFELVNMDDTTDILLIENGKFEITYDELKRDV